MTSPGIPTVLTYDLIPPRRPSIDDLQLDDKVDDDVDPPTDPAMPTADEANQQADQIAAAHKVLSLALVSVQITAGTPSVVQSSVMPSAVPVWTVTDNGPGDTTITWPAGSFPSAVVPAGAWLTQDVDATITCLAVANGVRVRTRVAGTLTDANFCFSLY